MYLPAEDSSSIDRHERRKKVDKIMETNFMKQENSNRKVFEQYLSLIRLHVDVCLASSKS